MDHRLTKRRPNAEFRALGYSSTAQKPGDPDVAAYLAAAGITDTTEKAAVTDAVLSLKASGVWNKLIYLFLCSPTSLAAALVNTKTAVSATNNGATHSSSGLATGGSNFFYASEFDFDDIPDFDFHASVYCSSFTPGNDQGLIGYKYVGVSGQIFMGIATGSGNSTLFGTYGEGGGTYGEVSIASTSGGMYLTNVESSSAIAITRDGVVNNLSTQSIQAPVDFNYPGNKVAIGTAYTYSDSSTRPGITTTIKAATLGYRLTSQQKTSLISAITTYQTALGRN